MKGRDKLAGRHARLRAGTPKRATPRDAGGGAHGGTGGRRGRLGTFGGSYMGFTQWALASTRPPHLKAMVVALATSVRSYSWYPGGSLALEVMIPWDIGAVGFNKPKAAAVVEDVSPEAIERQMAELRELDDWPPPTSSPTPWYLHPSGRLSIEPPAEPSAPDRYRYDPAGRRRAVRQLEPRPHRLLRVRVRRAPDGQSLNVCDALQRFTPRIAAPCVCRNASGHG